METTKTEESPWLVWDTYEITKGQAEFLQESQPEEYPDEETAWNVACQDHDIQAFEWEYLTEALTELMREVNPDGLEWAANVSNFGWRNQDGQATFQTDTGQGLLSAVLPNTDCTFKIYKRDGELAINNAHHDSPMWAEWYYIRPVKTCVYCGDPADMEHEGEDLCTYCHEEHYQAEEAGKGSHG